jgi:rRNA-processing protein FCF1
MVKKPLKILVDEMDDGMDEKLKEIGFDAYSVKKLRADGLKLHADYSLIKYAKENNMILITRDTESGEACDENGIPCILLDSNEIFKIVTEKLNCFN